MMQGPDGGIRIVTGGDKLDVHVARPLLHGDQLDIGVFQRGKAATECIQTAQITSDRRHDGKPASRDRGSRILHSQIVYLFSKKRVKKAILWLFLHREKKPKWVKNAKNG